MRLGSASSPAPLHSVGGEGQRWGRGEPLTRLWRAALFRGCPYGEQPYHTVCGFFQLLAARWCSYYCGPAPTGRCSNGNKMLLIIILPMRGNTDTSHTGVRFKGQMKSTRR